MKVRKLIHVWQHGQEYNTLNCLGAKQIELMAVQRISYQVPWIVRKCDHNMESKIQQAWIELII